MHHTAFKGQESIQICHITLTTVTNNNASAFSGKNYKFKMFEQFIMSAVITTIIIINFDENKVLLLYVFQFYIKGEEEAKRA